METKRLYYIDNLRWMSVLLVIVYHIIYLFNNSGVISNIGYKGIPVLDGFLVFVYPWFMCLLFVIAGIAARYSLNKRTNKEFIKDRAKRILLPTVLGMFIYGWFTGYITSLYTTFFYNEGANLPIIIKYFIFCVMGIGPLWFGHAVFLGALVIVLFRVIDKNKKLENLFEKINLTAIVLLVIAVWLSSFLFVVPVMSVYRLGIYILMMLLGYYVFSQERVIKMLSEISGYMLFFAAVLGVLYVIKYYGVNYTANSVLRNIFTNVYLWVMILALLGFGAKHLDFNNKFTEYMTENSFNYYILHYPLLVCLSHYLITYIRLPFGAYYIILAVSLAVLLPVLTEIVKRLPVLRFLILGFKNTRPSGI